MSRKSSPSSSEPSTDQSMDTSQIGADGYNQLGAATDRSDGEDRNPLLQGEGGESLDKDAFAAAARPGAPTRKGGFKFLKANGEHALSYALKGINFSYALSASTVFALLCIFRELGENDFDQFGLNGPSAKGVVNAISSLGSNLPMAIDFSFMALTTLKKAFHPNDRTGEGNWAFTRSIILGFFLATGTTAASVPLSNISLSKWASAGLAEFFTIIFGWNMFTTRAISMGMLIYELAQWWVKRGMKKDKAAENYFTLLEDLERLGPQIGLLNNPEIAKKIKNLKDTEISWKKNPEQHEEQRTGLVREILELAAETFYNELSRRNIPVSWSMSEKVSHYSSWGVAGVLMALTTLSAPVWASLVNQGLDAVFKLDSDSLPGGLSLGVGLFFLPHLALYLRTMYRAAIVIPRELYYRPELTFRFKDDPQGAWKKAGVVAMAMGVPMAFSYFSGAGYALSAATCETSGFGPFVDSSPLLSAIAVALKSSWTMESYSAFYWYFLAGSLVNGISALAGFMKHAPEWAQPFVLSGKYSLARLTPEVEGDHALAKKGRIYIKKNDHEEGIAFYIAGMRQTETITANDFQTKFGNSDAFPPEFAQAEAELSVSGGPVKQWLCALNYRDPEMQAANKAKDQIREIAASRGFTYKPQGSTSTADIVSMMRLFMMRHPRGKLANGPATDETLSTNLFNYRKVWASSVDDTSNPSHGASAQFG